MLFRSDRNAYKEPFLLHRDPKAKIAAAPTAGGWSGDPKHHIELDNAYAYAQQTGLPLPPGLIAHRPPANVPHGIKAGAYKFNRWSEPTILVVLSVEEQQGAELVVVFRQVKDGKAGWNFARGTLSGGTLEFLPSSGAARHILKWSDANSGSVTIMPGNSGNLQSGIFNGRFTRLDG